MVPKYRRLMLVTRANKPDLDASGPLAITSTTRRPALAFLNGTPSIPATDVTPVTASSSRITRR